MCLYITLRSPLRGGGLSSLTALAAGISSNEAPALTIEKGGGGWGRPGTCVCVRVCLRSARQKRGLLVWRTRRRACSAWGFVVSQLCVCTYSVLKKDEWFIFLGEGGGGGVHGSGSVDMLVIRDEVIVELVLLLNEQR